MERLAGDGRGPARQGSCSARQRTVRTGRAGVVWGRPPVRRARLARHGKAALGGAWRGRAGTAGWGTVLSDVAWQGRLGEAGQGLAAPGQAGKACSGPAERHRPGVGMAGQAWDGWDRRGGARRGRAAACPGRFGNGLWGNGAMHAGPTRLVP